MVTDVFMQDRTEIEPAPSDDLEIGEIRLPDLVYLSGLRLELIGRLDHDVP